MSYEFIFAFVFCGKIGIPAKIQDPRKRRQFFYLGIKGGHFFYVEVDDNVREW